MFNSSQYDDISPSPECSRTNLYSHRSGTSDWYDADILLAARWSSRLIHLLHAGRLDLTSAKIDADTLLSK